MSKRSKRSSYGQVLGQKRAFLPLFVGDIVSTTGSSIFGSAINYLVFIRTDSAPDVAFVGIAEFIPTILIGLFAGALVDRSNQKRLMVACDIIRSAVVAILPIYLILLARFSFPIIIIVVALVSVLSTIFRPAARSVMTIIVEKDLIQHANGLMTAAESLANSLSLAIGGVLIELVGASLTLFYNTATYLVSATMIILIIIPSAKAAPGSPQFVGPTNPTEIPLVTNDDRKSSLFSDVRDGMSYLSKNKAIMEMILSSTTFNFFFPLLSNFWVVYEVRFLLTTSGLIYGLLLSSFAIGQAIGALLSARLNALRYAGKTLILTNAICGFSMLVLTVSRNLFAATALLFVIGFGLGLSIGVYFSVLQTVVPREFLGRVISADEVATYTTVPLAQVAGAVLIGISGIVVDAEIAGIGLLLLTLVTAMLKDFRRLKVVEPSSSRN